jgi:glyoxylate reductase
MSREGQFKAWAPLIFLGCEVTGKTLGIIGLGRIGKALARKARGFNMTVRYYNRKPLNQADEERLEVKYLGLKELLAQADFISLHVPLTEETNHLISRGELKLMKPTAYLINTSRGPVVDEQALVEALKEKRIAGAGLDVYEREPEINPGLVELENVVLLPHVGSATWETRTKMARLAITNLLAGLRGERPPNCLNKEVFLK